MHEGLREATHAARDAASSRMCEYICPSCTDIEQPISAAKEAQVVASLDAIATAGARWALEQLEDQHACCTTGCGAVALDGDEAGFCPTCLLCQKLLAQLTEGTA